MSSQTEKPGLISSLAQVPVGELTAKGFPAEWLDRFAVLMHGGAATVLTVSEAMGSAAMFEIRRRLSEQGAEAVKFLPTTEEIIKLLHERQKTAQLLSQDTGEDTSTEKLVQDLVDDAVSKGASDIHIETKTDHAALYYRVNGTRILISNISFESARAMGVVLYSVQADATSKDVTWDPQQVMDSAIEHRTTDGKQVQLRFSSAPIFPSGNFHIVIRVLVLESSQIGLHELGYTQEQLNALSAMTTDLSGMVVLCGPTNSGKSTTMQALMANIHARRGETIKMITVEDPVEYIIDGACQIGVARKRKTTADERTGNAFTTFLRGTLRQDPDVVMVGEIRDIDSASVVKDLVLAGRKLITTLHTYSALWAFVRLRELQVPMELMTMPGFISGIVYQRLVPVLCPDTSIAFDEAAHTLPADLVARVRKVCHNDTHGVRLRGKGGRNGTGIVGRTVCAEFVVPDRKLLALVAEQRFLEAEQYWHQMEHLSVDGIGVGVLAHGIQKMRRGQLDPRDLEVNIARLDSLYEPTAH
ncbi:hypothetical protein AXE65_06405 [Ventosimonas gracilis]|uniref:Bacterial type II secretion system protein E domain-containing protein n=1 Tax=Ventosimonas gracilis TaxID=1680762 RepID=A0A139SLC6_9GAMM|nr:ATPase, T2SS/T4P/T4SS family [Ventosimonas gracilis]KXU35363.1 hypothetical protein AXE65_06405 [Ventosimonas gracilis]